MTRFYNLEIAIATGGIPEAVVLKDIYYWCNRNKTEGKNAHDGRFWTYNPMRLWQERFPEIRNIGTVLSKLVKDGWLETGVYNHTPFDRTKSYTVTAKSISLFEQMDSEENEIPYDVLLQPIPNSKTNKENITERIKKEKADVIDHLYSLYPTTTYRGERGVTSTGKCGKDRTRIAYLLRTHTPEQIEKSIKHYIEENNGRFLKNFSTFLNNMPEDVEESKGDSDTDERTSGQDW